MHLILIISFELLSKKIISSLIDLFVIFIQHRISIYRSPFPIPNRTFDATHKLSFSQKLFL